MPMMDATSAIQAWLAVGGLACIAGPLVAAVWWHRRSGTSYAVFAIGAVVFFICQPLLRLPWQIPLGAWVMRQHAQWQVAFLVFSALTAGLFEEGGRYAGYRLLLRGQWTRPVAVMYGLGHGGCEAILLVGLQLLGAAVGLYLAAHDRIHVPAVVDALRLVAASTSAGTVVAAVVERVSAVMLSVGLALIVLQAVVRGQLRWLGYAIAIHFAVDAVAPYALHGLRWPIVVVEAGLAVASAATLALGLAVSAPPRDAPRSSTPPA